jgi:hypothetical protein
MASAPNVRTRRAIVEDSHAETSSPSIAADRAAGTALAAETRSGGAPLDESRLSPCYANFCSVRRTIEEVILDFGLTTEFMGPSKHPVVLEQRVVMSYFTAKRLMEALRVSLQQHESVFGSVELDARKRAQQVRDVTEAAQAKA